MLELRKLQAREKRKRAQGGRARLCCPEPGTGRFSREQGSPRTPGKEAWVPDSSQKEPRLPTTPSTGPLIGTPTQTQQKDIKVTLCFIF